MSRKHFKAFADAIAKAIASREAKAEFCEIFCRIAIKTNPRFDRAKFYEACGL